MRKLYHAGPRSQAAGRPPSSSDPYGGNQTASGSGGAADPDVLTQDELNIFYGNALQRWYDAGVWFDAITALIAATTFEVSDRAGAALGLASGGLIRTSSGGTRPRSSDETTSRKPRSSHRRGSLVQRLQIRVGVSVVHDVRLSDPAILLSRDRRRSYSGHRRPATDLLASPS